MPSTFPSNCCRVCSISKPHLFLAEFTMHIFNDIMYFTSPYFATATVRIGTTHVSNTLQQELNVKANSVHNS